MNRIRTPAIAFAAALAFGAPVAHAVESRAVVYFHEDFHHYFMTANAAEIAALDVRAVSGWWRAGQRFLVETEPGPGLAAVCRFLTTAHAAKASHFFTASAAECAAVKGKADWTYEGIAFYVRTPEAGGACGASTVPVHRLYNNGRGGAPNHAYTPEDLQRDRLKENGFVEEGVAFCVRTEGEPAAKLQPLLGTTWDFRDGNDGTGGLGVQRAVFASTAGSTPALDSLFLALGMPVTGVNVTFQATANSRSGAVTWDRVSASYLMVVALPLGHPESVYVFDSIEAPVFGTCQFDVFWGASEQPYTAFQPHVWHGWWPGGCLRNQATKR